MESSRITGEGPDGRQHVMRITRGYGDVRHVKCETCGYRRQAVFSARAKAEEHLSSDHGADGFRQEFSPAPIILGVIGFIVFVIGLAVLRPGH
ncbi:hypothetical protein [Kitasatospora sp. NPDC058190]|uniref:hypothetical protein n=1 Tax=Kitasatospora sp. NPDC058190 TaxID=3346371 RepID=UPI0036D85573